MSDVTQTKCDGCGKLVADQYTVAGWIHLDGAISITKGRRDHVTSQALVRYAAAMERDFCCVKCLTEFLRSLT